MGNTHKSTLFQTMFNFYVENDGGREALYRWARPRDLSERVGRPSNPTPNNGLPNATLNPFGTDARPRNFKERDQVA